MSCFNPGSNVRLSDACACRSTLKTFSNLAAGYEADKQKFNSTDVPGYQNFQREKQNWADMIGPFSVWDVNASLNILLRYFTKRAVLGQPCGLAPGS